MTTERVDNRLDPNSWTEEQRWLFKRFSEMIGDVLDVVETALPAENQFLKARKLLNKVMYDTRNEVILEFLPPPYGFAEEE